MSSMATTVAAAARGSETRVASPANFLVKIDSFSLLQKHGIQRLETREFKAGNYMWRLVIYPNGHGTGKDDKVADYVSVYLAITNTTALPSNWEVNATFSICLFNHVSGNYVYSQGRARRFHAIKQEWGFMKFISKKDLTDPSKGYLVDDKCVLGAEVFVNENKAVIECLSLKSVDKEPYKHEFKITNFSRLKAKWVSKEFTVGGYQWVIDVYPNGNGQGAGSNLSIFLRRVVSNNRTFFEKVIACIFPSDVVSNNRASFGRVMPCFTIRIKDQSYDLKHHQHTCSGRWFPASKRRGWHSFIKLSSLNDPKKGFIVNDCCVIEVELAVQAISP
ncbi:hypothetical protein CASFOL_012387 [Castilleja foliolosa]|uniref:MATH domain-containing protein n=1 Tax=Castilleja foliolosa TaxID=1961234 RepID=A0ABD3DIR6_9LAMI